MFTSKFRNQISKYTGFNYSIDFISFYENFTIPEKFLNQDIFANKYHLDKPNTKNMLKIFILMKDTNMDDGPLEFIDQEYSKINVSIDGIEKCKKKIFCTGNIGDLFLIKTNLCWHKAGNPKDGHKSKLLMLQLNPSFRWKLRNDLYQRQYKIEPKFTSIINIFSRKNDFMFID